MVEDVAALPSISAKLKIDATGFDDDLGQSIVELIGLAAKRASMYLPLGNVVAITIDNFYPAALSTIRRGFEASLALQPTHDPELGTGAAMAVLVKRHRVPKSHLVFGPSIVRDFLEGRAEAAYKIIAHELAHAADRELKRRALGNIELMVADDLIPDAKDRFLWELGHSIWDEYFASRVSVAMHPDGEAFEDELFSATMVKFQERVQQARHDYQFGKISLDEFIEALRSNARLLIMAAGYLLGLIDGLGTSTEKVAPKSAALLQGKIGIAILRFYAELRKLWERRGQWKSYDEFLALNAPMEALLGDLNLYVHTQESGRLYMSVP